MSDTMRATKTEPVLQWQTKEELQRGKNGIEKRDGCSVEDDRRGRRRTGDVQVDAGGEKVEADVVERERRRGTGCEGNLEESEGRATIVEGRMKRSKMIPNSWRDEGSRARDTRRPLLKRTCDAAETIIKEENEKVKDVSGRSKHFDEENKRLKKVDEPYQGKDLSATSRKRRDKLRISEGGDVCNNNEWEGVDEETLTMSISDDTAGWILGNKCFMVNYLRQLCGVSLNVRPWQYGEGGRTIVIKGSSRGVGEARAIVKLDVGQPHLMLTEEGARRLIRDRFKVEER